MPPRNDDLQASNNLKRIDDLESFKNEFTGKAFDKKVLDSIKESHTIREELSLVVWQTVRNKIVWIILGALGLVLLDILIRLIPAIISKLINK